MDVIISCCTAQFFACSLVPGLEDNEGSSVDPCSLVPGLEDNEGSSVDPCSASEDEGTSVDLKPEQLPSVQNSTEQNKWLQKTLDKYQVTAQQEKSGSRAIVSGVTKSFSYICKVLFPKLLFIPRWVPEVIASYFIGSKKAAVISTGPGICAEGVGFTTDRSDKELYLTKPEDNLRAKKESLEEELSTHKKCKLKARNEIEKEAKNLRCEGVDLKTDDLGKPFADIEDISNQAGEMSKFPAGSEILQRDFLRSRRNDSEN